MKRTAIYFGLILGLCVPFLATAQDPGQPNAERVKGISSSVEHAIKDKEKNWSIKDKNVLSRSTSQRWRSGAQEVHLRIFIYGSEAEASKMLVNHGSFSVGLSDELKGFAGDEARYLEYLHFTWVGVRKGAIVIEAQGPARNIALTKRFVRHALQELEKN
jgi:hypothetical protein